MAWRRRFIHWRLTKAREKYRRAIIGPGGFLRSMRRVQRWELRWIRTYL